MSIGTAKCRSLAQLAEDACVPSVSACRVFQILPLVWIMCWIHFPAQPRQPSEKATVLLYFWNLPEPGSIGVGVSGVASGLASHLSYQCQPFLSPVVSVVYPWALSCPAILGGLWVFWVPQSPTAMSPPNGEWEGQLGGTVKIRWRMGGLTHREEGSHFKSCLSLDPRQLMHSGSLQNTEKLTLGLCGCPMSL